MQIRRSRVATIAVSVLWLAGCAHTSPSAPLRIDGSSPAAFQASWDRMHRSLTREQQAQLDVAVLPIAFGPYKSFTKVPPALLAGVGPKDIRSRIDGMTFEEILALARSEPVAMRRQFRARKFPDLYVCVGAGGGSLGRAIAAELQFARQEISSRANARDSTRFQTGRSHEANRSCATHGIQIGGREGGSTRSTLSGKLTALAATHPRAGSECGIPDYETVRSPSHR